MNAITWANYLFYFYFSYTGGGKDCVEGNSVLNQIEMLDKLEEEAAAEDKLAVVEDMCAYFTKSSRDRLTSPSRWEKLMRIQPSQLPRAGWQKWSDCRT